MTVKKSEKDKEIAKLKRKLNKAVAEKEKANAELKAQRKENRKLKSQAEKNKKKREDDKADSRTKQITFRTIKGYEFNEFVIKLASLLRSSVTVCGSKSIVKILTILNECFNSELFDKIPSNQTIEDWCEKAGLDMHTGVKDKFTDKDYLTITDESISVGKQKLLLQLGVPTDCTGRPLVHSDVSILGMSVDSSWTGDKVKTEMEKVSNKIGRKPLYSVSDNGGNLCNACRDAGIPHHRDISHAFGSILKKHYSELSEFKKLTSLIDKKRLASQLTDKAIVIPPKQRSIARFMNIFGWVEWTHRLLSRYNTLTNEQKKAASFLKKHEELIEELNAIRGCMEYVEYRCKHDGLSKELAKFLMWRIVAQLIISTSSTKRMREVGIDMLAYIQDECKLLHSEKEVHIVSSDIIESCFGVFKAMKSPDKLCGITKHALVLPLAVNFTSKENRESFDFKAAMENVHYRDLDEWAGFNLYGNPAQERIELFRKAG